MGEQHMSECIVPSDSLPNKSTDQIAQPTDGQMNDSFHEADTILQGTRCHPPLSKVVLLFVIGNVCGYVLNCSADFIVAYYLVSEGDYNWFALTAGVTITSLIIVNLFSVHWYWSDHYFGASAAVDRAREIRKKEPTTKLTWFLRILMHILLMGPLMRMCAIMKYARRTLHFQAEVDKEMQKGGQGDNVDSLKALASDYYVLYVIEDRDVCLLDLMLAFLQDAPQLVLQIYILTRRPQGYYKPIITAAQVASIFISLISKSWSIASYHRALRFSMLSGCYVSLSGTFMQFFWRLGTVSSRVLALALFAKVFKEYLIYGFLIHWGVMSLWIMAQNTNFCDTATGEHRCLEERFFNIVLGFVNSFCFLNVKDNKTRYRLVFFYTIVFCENVAMVVVWFIVDDNRFWYHIPGLVAVPTTFFFGMIFMLVYYLNFRPADCSLPVTRRPHVYKLS